MNVSMTYRGIQSSPTIDAYVQEKVKRVERMLNHERSPIKLEVVLESHPTHAQHAVELRLHCADYHVRAQGQGADLYAQIDLAFDRLLEEVRREKDRRVSTRKEQNI